MANIANLTLKNAAAANVTYEPHSVERDACQWNEAGATSYLGTSRLKVQRKLPTDKANGVLRVMGQLTRPVVNGTTMALDGVITGNFEILRPIKLANTEVDEFAARFGEAVKQSIIAEAAKTGAIPT
jgi:hypothetical protein